MFFETWARSWEFAKLSYSTLWDHKHLIVFPVISSIASLMVVASFLLPLWQTGQLEAWMAAADGDGAAGQSQEVGMYVTMFLFYFCNYFVIVFFNTALVASVMRILEGEEGTIAFGLSFAIKRIHAIFGWALVSAVVGMLLKALERNDKIGRIVASLLGSAWTALTYFVVPVIVTDGVGPIEAFKRSMRTLKDTWGTALTGNFSLGTFSFLITLPVIALGVFLFMTATPVVALAVTVPLFFLTLAISSTADFIFKAYLYTYATGRALPESVDSYAMRDAFRRR
ncbi:DUF6159 family protein [Coraliomargarita parva]|uniref:DUF6159 family protein n=1 Tax=Coraliomargarita parva TaxID=3014050 RepID=UPI0022B56E75|nr:DUF6159 family protein [Coraliomargarita parva]